MSTEVEKNNVTVTSVVTKKDPKRVEQGKRLAQISKEAKERKMREKIESEKNDADQNYFKYVSPILSTLSLIGCTYLLFFGSPFVKKSEISFEQSERSESKKIERSEPKKFESF